MHGLTLAVARLETIELWDVKTWKLRTTLRRQGGGEAEHVYSVSTSHDGKVVVSMSNVPFSRKHEQRVNIWSGTAHRTLGPGEAYVPLVSPDGKVIGMTRPDQEFAVLDAATGKPKTFGP